MRDDKTHPDCNRQRRHGAVFNLLANLTKHVTANRSGLIAITDRVIAHPVRAVPKLAGERCQSSRNSLAGIYRRLLDRIAADPEAVLRGRVSLPGREKAYVAVRGLAGFDSRRAARRRV